MVSKAEALRRFHRQILIIKDQISLKTDKSSLNLWNLRKLW